MEARGQKHFKTNAKAKDFFFEKKMKSNDNGSRLMVNIYDVCCYYDIRTTGQENDIPFFSFFITARLPCKDT